MIYLIAELGINHDGCYKTAQDLIYKAKLNQCDAVKFQYRSIKTIKSHKEIEIGDESVRKEVLRNYLTPSEIVKLLKFAHSLKLEVGISFFTIQDLKDFKTTIHKFDFFKVPSAVNMDFQFIDYLLKFKKRIFISLGMLNHDEIEIIKNRYGKNPLLIPFHCISNYPTKIFNTQLSYLKYLQNNWRQEVGYSSHDDNLLVLAKAIDLNVKYIERHITLDKSANGLDHSSSSTPSEFRELKEYSKYSSKLVQSTLRVRNQGEIVNLQSLGLSLYAKKKIQANSLLTLDLFTIRSPRIGLTSQEFINFDKPILKKSISKGDPLTRDLISTGSNKMSISPNFINSNKISIPVRFKDYKQAEELFKSRYFEFHLSRNDLMKIPKNLEINSTKKYSIHVPDYLDSTTLIDLFSKNRDLKIKSRQILKDCVTFSRKLQSATNSPCPLIMSINTSNSDINLYLEVKKLQKLLKSKNILFYPQWLPPFAWYFGGSVALHYFNSVESIKEILRYQINICFDLSHFILSANYFGFRKHTNFKKLRSLIKHYHLAGASGYDSEGITLKSLDKDGKRILKDILKSNSLKVMEIWQGHLNQFSGFSHEIVFLEKMCRKFL